MRALGSNSKGKMTLILAEWGTVDSGMNPIEYSVFTPLVVSIGSKRVGSIE